MRVADRIALKQAMEKIAELEARVKALEAKKGPGRPRKVPADG